MKTRSHAVDVGFLNNILLLFLLWKEIYWQRENMYVRAWIWVNFIKCVNLPVTVFQFYASYFVMSIIYFPFFLNFTVINLRISHFEMNSSREFDTYIFIYIFRDILKVNRSHKHAHLQFTANFQSSIIPKKIHII